jgi:ATP-dependent DNA helicase RecQ
MLQIHGVGRAKLDRYGSIFLKVVEDYHRDHPVENEPAGPPNRVPKRRGSARAMRELAIGEAFNSGRTIEKLAQEFNIRESRVLDYLLSYYQEGHPLRAKGFLPLITHSGHQVGKAMEAFQELGPDLLRPVFDALSGAIGYEDLKVLRLYYLSLQDPAGGCSISG